MEFRDDLDYVPENRKRCMKSNKKEFAGWGSLQLFEFLESIRVDTAAKQLSHHDVTDIVYKYINDNNLINPKKKKRVVCDERLLALFGRKSVGRIKIHDLLEPHFAENQESSSASDRDGSFVYSSDEGDGNLKKRVSGSARKPYPKKLKQVEDSSKSSFAAIIPENIKLVYLKKSLVEILLKDPETFESKIIGSFIRIKSDPNDITQKNPYQLLLVTGVKKDPGDSEKKSEVLLEVSNYFKKIRICMLSDGNFSQEECDDLHNRIKDGLLQRLKVVDLQEKVQALHQNITTHVCTLCHIKFSNIYVLCIVQSY